MPVCQSAGSCEADLFIITGPMGDDLDRVAVGCDQVGEDVFPQVPTLVRFDDDRADFREAGDDMETWRAKASPVISPPPHI